jgi:putative spermidine/putrescine transport system ATP-binding protein
VNDVTLDGVRVERDRRLVLDVPSLTFRGGRTTAILGPNGSGKTTLLRLIAGLEHPRTGRVSIGGSPAGMRQRLAYVFQEQVFLRQSVRDNLELGLRLRGVEQAARRRRIDEAADLVGVAHLLDRQADRLSGGEGRRVSLARALCLRAPLVLLDEPLAGLDERAYSRLIDELPRIVDAFHATTLLVTHRPEEALRLAQDLVVLVDGKVHAAGDRHEIATNPRVSEVAQALGHTVLAVGGRRVAVPPGALKVGGGRLEFSMTVDSVVDVLEFREFVGRIGETGVRVQWTAAGDSPGHGDRVLVHAERFCDVV